VSGFMKTGDSFTQTVLYSTHAHVIHIKGIALFKIIFLLNTSPTNLEHLNQKFWCNGAVIFHISIDERSLRGEKCTKCQYFKIKDIGWRV
jgi:hypothetical protein